MLTQCSFISMDNNHLRIISANLIVTLFKLESIENREKVEKVSKGWENVKLRLSRKITTHFLFRRIWRISNVFRIFYSYKVLFQKNLLETISKEITCWSNLISSFLLPSSGFMLLLCPSNIDVARINNGSNKLLSSLSNQLHF